MKYQKRLSCIRPVILFMLVMVASLILWPSSLLKAADMSKFEAGNIMSDAVMSNKDTMGVQDIQNFLNSKNSCNDTALYKTSWYPNQQFHIENGHFVCMAQEVFDGESTALIIWNTAQYYKINPQLLIVLLEKEQGLVTDTWPSNIQYRSATGYGCPDTAACDSQYYGFKNQLSQAAKLFRTVLDGGWSNFPVGQQYVQYNPNSSCGGKVINIANRATSALYRYTPYQPNEAALNNQYGSGDSCSAYGNRNFWRVFNDWFGSTQGPGGFVSLNDPRWMQINVSTTKINPYSGKKVGPDIPAGTQAKFVDKLYINGVWVARTQWDHDNGTVDGFLAEELSDIPFTAIPASWMTIPNDVYKIDPLRSDTYEKIKGQSLAKFVDQITVNGKLYLRTEYESSQNRSRVVPRESLSEAELFSFKSPRLMVNKAALEKVDLLTGEIAGSLSAGNTSFYNKLVYYQDVLYAQLASDGGSFRLVDSRELDEVTGSLFQSAGTPKYMRLSSDTTKYNVTTNTTVGPILTAGTDAMFVDRVKIDGTWYARTKWDNTQNSPHAIPLSHLADIPTTPISKTEYTVVRNTKKVDPLTELYYEAIPSGSKAYFVDKITVMGKEYYRTEWEANQNRLRLIAAEDINL